MMSRILASVRNIVKQRHFPRIAVINLNGTILSQSNPSRFGGPKYLNLEVLEPAIKKAFSIPKLDSVCLLINSPGGSPVQAELITDKISLLSKEKNVKVLSFIEDIAASGGYWLAVAGKEIYACKNSAVGSIGVISSTFGLQEFLKKYGIERRVYHAGDNKSFLDIFQAEKQEDVEKLQKILNQVHVNFINHVKDSRGSRLKESDKFLFNGDFWIAEDAEKYGLIDGIKTFNTYLHENYGGKCKLIRVNKPGSRGLSSLFGGSFNAYEYDDIIQKLPMLK